ncbi:MAG TPA: hypothetical protein VJJ26_00030 [Candidatus Babeliales bacterium]|nr:hypothetical protein [Candidatus Babeliales bacterium]
MLMINEDKFNTLLLSLKYIYGLVPIAIGLDKFFFYIVNWNIYVSPTVILYLPSIITPKIVPIVGIIEIIAGIIILSKYTRFGAYLVAAWLGVVILNLLTIGGMYDIILRDIAILVGYVAFGVLTELKETARQQ